MSKDLPAAARATFYTVAETARLLRVDTATIYRAIREDAFPAIRVRSRYVVPAAAVEQLAARAAETGSCVDVAAIATKRRLAREVTRLAEGRPAMTESQRYEQLAAELDELAAVPTEVLADWVTTRGRCLWETTFGEPPEWTGQDEPDRELATRLCAGCPVRSECLEFELRLGGAQTVGVWGALNAEDRRALHKVWSSRSHEDIARGPGDEDGGQR